MVSPLEILDSARANRPEPQSRTTAAAEKIKHQKYGHWIIAIDRTQGQGRNVFMVSLVWGTHALPLYWEVLKSVGNSDLKTQKRLLKTVLPLFKSYPVLVLADREFHSPKLASWLDGRGISFALR